MLFFRYFIGLFLVTNCFAETTFLLVRHGETEWNRLKKIHGQADIPLNEQGILQAQTLAQLMTERYPDIDHLHSSDLSRAVMTAEILSQEWGLSFSKHAALREIRRGASEGLSYEESDALYGRAWKACEIPGAEETDAALSRIQSFLTTIGTAHPEKKIVIVTHGEILGILTKHIQAPGLKKLHFSNCSVLELIYTPENEEAPFRIIGISNLLSKDH